MGVLDNTLAGTSQDSLSGVASLDAPLAWRDSVKIY
jgi:hypothetical protein